MNQFWRSVGTFVLCFLFASSLWLIYDQKKPQIILQLRNIQAKILHKPTLVFFTLPEGKSRQAIIVGSSKVRLDVYRPADKKKTPVVILLHGSGGIEDQIRSERYHRFAMDLMNDGITAINVYYFDSSQDQWQGTVRAVIDYAMRIRGVDSDKVGLVGYSLGGTLALSVASQDARVKALALASGTLPIGFNGDQAKLLPPTAFITGDKDKSFAALQQLRQWFKSYKKPIEFKINPGQGHVIESMDEFYADWNELRGFLSKILKK